MCFLVKHPSGDGDAVYQFVIKIAAEVLVFIKDCCAVVRGVVISTTLLAGFIPHLQVTPLVLLEGFIVRVTRCERLGQNQRIIPCDPYHVVSDFWVAHVM